MCKRDGYRCAYGKKAFVIESISGIRLNVGIWRMEKGKKKYDSNVDNNE